MPGLRIGLFIGRRRREEAGPPIPGGIPNTPEARHAALSTPAPGMKGPGPLPDAALGLVWRAGVLGIHWPGA